MYKSKSMKEVTEGATRTGANKSQAQRNLQTNAPFNGKWNKGKLPKGANKSKSLVGQVDYRV